MLRSIKDFVGYKITAREGEIGEVAEFYFDDVNWTIRYLIVNTGNWLKGRQVLISPAAIGKTDTNEKRLQVNLTKKQVEDSPDISTEKPVSRQNEIELLNYYNWPVYWDFDMGMSYTPASAYLATNPVPESNKEEGGSRNANQNKGDPHLRSSREVIGYKIQATDKEIGHVKDFIVDDSVWIIRYMAVDTGNWLIAGRKVLVSPHWIDNVNWPESKVHVVLSSDSIRNSPEYNPSETLNRDYEEILYEHYGLPKYWV